MLKGLRKIKKAPNFLTKEEEEEYKLKIKRKRKNFKESVVTELSVVEEIEHSEDLIGVHEVSNSIISNV